MRNSFSSLPYTLPGLSLVTSRGKWREKRSWCKILIGGLIMKQYAVCRRGVGEQFFCQDCCQLKAYLEVDMDLASEPRFLQNYTVDENCCNWEAVDTLVLPPALCLPPLINTYSWTFAGTHRRLFPTHQLNEGAIFTMCAWDLYEFSWHGHSDQRLYPVVTCCSEEGYFFECEAAASRGPCAQTSASQERFRCFWRIGEGWLRLDSIDSWWLIEPTLVL